MRDFSKYKFSGKWCIWILRWRNFRKVMVLSAWCIVRNGIFVWQPFVFISFTDIKLNFSAHQNSINSSNANRFRNALHIHLSNQSWFAFYIQPLTKANNIYVESRLEQGNLITYYHFLKWVTVLRKIAKNDVGENQNVNIWTVSGKLKNAFGVKIFDVFVPYDSQVVVLYGSYVIKDN